MITIGDAVSAAHPAATGPMNAPAAKLCTNPDHAGPNPLPVSEFHRDTRTPGGLTSRCKACTRVDGAAARRRRREADPEKVREAQRRYRAANPEAGRQYYAANADKLREQQRQSHQRKRDAVLDHYGRVCACCGGTDRLAIDHIGGGGNQHRAQLGRGNAFYRWLISQGFPDGFQTLCKPCNTSKGNGPVCKLHRQRGGQRPARGCIYYYDDNVGRCLGYPEMDDERYPPLCPTHLELFMPMIEAKAPRARRSARGSMTELTSDQADLEQIRLIVADQALDAAAAIQRIRDLLRRPVRITFGSSVTHRTSAETPHARAHHA